MASKHPYVSTTGVLTQVFDHLQKSFPSTFNAETLKKLGFAPANESYIVNTVRFLGLVSEEDQRTELAQKVFTQHETASFQKAFSDLIRKAYSDLFALHNDAAWTLGDDKLIPFFRQTDQTSQIVGSRQASTFRTLAAYAGHPSSVSTKAPKATSAKTSAPAKKAGKIAPKAQVKEPADANPKRDVGLTVRIEVNLPSTGDQDTYDKIFKSIRENLLNA